MYKPLLSSSVLALLCVSSLAQADTTAPIDQSFFSVGGPNKTLTAAVAAPATVTTPTVATTAASAAPATPAVDEPAPMPDPTLFTNVKNLSEQTSDNAYDIFGLGKRARAAEAEVAAVATPGAATGTTVATAGTPAPQQGVPDPSLFTNPGTPNEQTRDHPFKLF